MDNAVTRALDPAERYFALLDQLVAMNVLVSATFSRPVSPAEVEAAWSRLCASSLALRCRIDFTDNQTPVVTETAERAADFLTVCDLEMSAAMQIEQDTQFDTERGSLARCRLGKPDGGPDYLLLTLSHALIDGRGGLELLRMLVGEIDSPGSARSIQSLPGPMHERLPISRRWSGRRREMVELLRELSRERAGQTPEPCAWHSRAAGTREIRLTSTRLSSAQTAELVATARAAGTSFYGLLGAATLQDANAAFDDGQTARELAMMTAIDLRRYFADPEEADAMGMYASMLSAVYEVSAGQITELSRRISHGLKTQMARGEGELFYDLSRCAGVALSPGDAQWASTSLDAAPASVAVSNLGVVDHRGDPDWLISMSATLAPTPNQVAFVAATTYRDRVTINASVDSRSMSDRRARNFGDLTTLHSLLA